MKQHWLRRILMAAALVAVLLPWQPRTVWSGPAGTPPSGLTAGPVTADWRQGYSLVTLKPGTDLAATRSKLEAAGMRVALVYPPSAILGWVTDPSSLSALSEVASVDSAAVDESRFPIEDSPLQYAGRFLNAVVTGSLEWNEKVSGDLLPLHEDGRSNAFVDSRAIRDNLQDQGVAADAASASGNSDVMIGTVTVNVFFVESTGSIDPNRYTWTDQHVEQTLNKINAALSWWSSQAALRGKRLSFYINAYFPTDTRCQTGYEPITRRGDDAPLWIDRVLTQFGYKYGGYLTKAASFNSWSRSQFKTDWAYSAFVEYNPLPAPDRFTDGYSAWAYIGGPLVNALFRSFGWSFDRTFAHETGHIFGACDEYYQPGYGGCGACTTCRNGVPNANCQQCNSDSVPCLMRENTWSLCEYTQGHIGWGLPPGVVSTDATALGFDEPVTGTTAGRLNNQSHYGVVGWNESGPEVVYRLTLDRAMTFTVTLSNLTVNLDIFVLTECNKDSLAAFGDISTTMTDANAGTYCIAVDGRNSASGSYTLTATGLRTPETLRIPVQPGWNLLALPALSVQLPLTQALASLAGNYDGVYAFDPAAASGPWKSYFPGGPPIHSLNSLDGRTAFWLHATAAGVLESTGNGPDPKGVALRKGWNLVPYPGLSARPIGEALRSVAQEIERVYMYDAAQGDPWQRYSRTAPVYANQVTQLIPGRGYWVLANAECIWVAPE